MPANIEIITTPVCKTIIEVDENYIYVFGFLRLVEVTKFSLMKLIPNLLTLAENGSTNDF